MRRSGAWLTPTLGAVAVVQLVLGLRRLRRTPVPRGLPLRRRLEALFAAFAPQPIAKLAATEALVIWYALHWRAKPDIPAGATPIFYHRGARPMLWVLAGAGLVELIVLHVIALVFWGPKLAWPLFALSEIGLVYVLGLISSLDKLPILVFDDRIEVRMGLLATHVLPADNILAIHAALDPARTGDEVLKASLAAPPTVGVELCAPMTVRSLKRRGPAAIRMVGLRPDDVHAFLRATDHLGRGRPAR